MQRLILLISMVAILLGACDDPKESNNSQNNNLPDGGVDVIDDGTTDGDITEDVFVPPEEVWPPERVHFRTATRSFNRQWYVALHEGQIWVKPNEEVTGSVADWQLLGNTGRPESGQFPNFGVPETITEISADGVHLM
ncbi:hypothetical protein KKF84_09800, partial [Myxococcota bacterium]|nr:hypothetical protein [Myxococcota bacterium]